MDSHNTLSNRHSQAVAAGRGITGLIHAIYDENGVPHLCVDEELRRRLETKLITKILDFDVTRAA